MDVRFGLIPYFALGPVANVSSPTSSGGDSLALGMDDVDRRFDVGGPDFSDVGITSPSSRVVVVTGGCTAKRSAIALEAVKERKNSRQRVLRDVIDTIRG